MSLKGLESNNMHKHTHVCSVLPMDECPFILREATKKYFSQLPQKRLLILEVLLYYGSDRIRFIVFFACHNERHITLLPSNVCPLEVTHFLLFPQGKSHLSGHFPVKENLHSALKLQCRQYFQHLLSFLHPCSTPGGSTE